MSDKNPYRDLLNEFGLGEGKNVSSAEEAKANDRRIENALLYLMTEGYTKMAPTVNPSMLVNIQSNPEDIDRYSNVLKKKEDFQKEFNMRFSELKHRIDIKELTIEEFEDKVYSDYGIVSEYVRKRGNPLEFEDPVVFMSDEEYKEMRKSYDGQDTA